MWMVCLELGGALLFIKTLLTLVCIFLKLFLKLLRVLEHVVVSLSEGGLRNTTVVKSLLIVSSGFLLMLNCLKRYIQFLVLLVFGSAILLLLTDILINITTINTVKSPLYFVNILSTIIKRTY